MNVKSVTPPPPRRSGGFHASISAPAAPAYPRKEARRTKMHCLGSVQHGTTGTSPRCLTYGLAVAMSYFQIKGRRK